MTHANQSQGSSEDWRWLLERWQEEEAASRLQLRRKLLLQWVTATLAFTLTMWAFLHNPLASVLLIVFAMVIGTVFASDSLTKNTRQGYHRIAAKLRDIEDVSAAGPLLELHQKEEGEALEALLARLLPRLRRSDADLLTYAQKSLLYRAIVRQTGTRSSDFVCACLDAVENIGDIHALPALAFMIMKDAPTPKEQAIRVRARLCLASLMSRLDFGGVQDIPGWINKLPYRPYTDAPYQISGTWEDALTAVFALTRLLPRLRPADSPLLNAAARKRMGEAWSGMYPIFMNVGEGMLHGGEHYRLGPDFKLAMLEAFGQIGTGQDIQYVASQAYGDAPSDDVRRVREKARDVLATLKERREKEREGETLLRGASAPAAAPETLLRAANGHDHAGDAHSAELLRAPTDAADQLTQHHHAAHAPPSANTHSVNPPPASEWQSHSQPHSEPQAQQIRHE